jgi:hypothetical protein
VPLQRVSFCLILSHGFPYLWFDMNGNPVCRSVIILGLTFIHGL